MSARRITAWGLRVSAPNGFAGAWNPLCPHCGGYMHAGHTPDCPATLARDRSNARLLKLLRGTHDDGAPVVPVSGSVSGCSGVSAGNE